MLSRHKTKIALTVALFISVVSAVAGQDRLITGMVTDSTGLPLEAATVIHHESLRGITTDSNGKFVLSIPADSRENSVEISLTGFVTRTISFPPGEKDILLPVTILSHKYQTPGSVSVTALRKSGASEIIIPVTTGYVMPSVSHSIESLIKTLPGVSSFSELSNQYSVRGGSMMRTWYILMVLKPKGLTLSDTGNRKG